MHNSCDVLIWSWSFYNSESSQWHIAAYMRDTRHTFPTVDWFLISYAINCVQIPTTLLAYLENTRYHRQCYLRYTGNLIHLEDGTKLLSPTPRRRHSTHKSFESDYLRSRWHFVWEDRDEMWRPLNQESWIFCTLEKQGKRMAANRTTGWENGFTSIS